MLERAAACIEPTVYLFTRRIEPPIRSVRVLGHAFWRHGGDHINIPPWWPSYLESVRQSPHTASHSTPTEVVRTARCLKKATSHAAQIRRKASKSQIPKGRGSRQYSQTQSTQQGTQAVEKSESYAYEISAAMEQHAHGHVRDTGPAEQEKRSQDPGSDSAITAKETQPDSQSLGEDEVLSVSQLRKDELQSILRRPAHVPKDYQKVWKLFVALPDQEPLASSVLGYLSTSALPQDLDRAMQAFTLILEEDKLKKDYDAAVQIAVKRRRYNLGFQLCEQAMAMDAATSCRQTLLVACLSNGFYRTAARVWRTFFDSFPIDALASNSDWSVMRRELKLPDYCLQLMRRLRRKDSALMHEPEFYDTLIKVVERTTSQILRSPQILAIMTPKGLLRLLFELRQLSALQPLHYQITLETLVSPAIRRSRADLAVVVHRNFRFTFPEHHLSQGRLISLIVLCDRERYQPEIFDYWHQELKSTTEKPHAAAYRHLMWAYAHQGGSDKVDRLFEQLVSEHGPPNEARYINPRLYAHAAAGNVSLVERIMQESERRYGLLADIYTWNLLFFAHTRSNQPRGVFAAFDKMDKSKVTPDAVTFQTLIGTCSRIGDTFAAKSLVEIARDYHVQVNDEMMAKIADSHCMNGRPDEAEKLALEISSMGLDKPPVRTWNTVLKYYAFQANFRAIRALQNSMRAAGVEPDEMTYAALLTSLTRIGKTADAAKLLRGLHFDGTTTATSFHYSIILHGFAMEKNRDMVMVIYREMQDRFPRVSPSARLAVLHTCAHRGWNKMLDDIARLDKHQHQDVKHSVSFLNEILSQSSPVDWMTSEPQPGFKRQSAYQAVPHIYSDFLARRMAVSRRPLQAQKFLEIFRIATDQHESRIVDRHMDSIESLTTRLIVALRLLHWDVVDRLWRDILQKAVQSTMSGSTPFKIPTGGPETPLDVLNHLELLLESRGRTVLPAQKRVLSIPLSMYMQALDQQGRHEEIVALAEGIQRLGFELSSKNWNSYLQILCRSSSTEHKTLAFSLFQSLMIRNTPSWEVVSSSKWVKAWKYRTVNPRPTPAPRKLIEQMNPRKIIPTYFTLVFMASVLLRFRREALNETSSDLERLKQVYPEAVRRIQAIPYIRDKIRRVVLSAKRPYSDSLKKPRYPKILRAGIAGSKSQLDQAPVQHLDEIQSLVNFHSSKTSRDSHNVEAGIRAAELSVGETIQDRMAKEKRGGRESESERQARIQRRATSGLRELDKIQRALRAQPLTTEDYTGDPRHVARFPIDEPESTVPDLRLLPDLSYEIDTARRLRKRMHASSVGRIPSFKLTQKTTNAKSRHVEKAFTRARASRQQVMAARRKAITEKDARMRRARVEEAALTEPAVQNPGSSIQRLKWEGTSRSDEFIEKLLPRRSGVPLPRRKRQQRESADPDLPAITNAEDQPLATPKGGDRRANSHYLSKNERRKLKKEKKANDVGTSAGASDELFDSPKEGSATTNLWKWRAGEDTFKS